MSNARKKYMLALANFVNGSELGYEDRSSIPQYKKDIEDYVDSLEKVNQKYKEVIDKAMNELFNLKDMIYNPETREKNIDIQRKISSIIKDLNNKEVE